MRKIIIITLISLSLSFNLRFLQNKEEIYKVNEEVKNASEKINGFQKNKDVPAPRLIKVIRGSGNKSNKGNRTRSTDKFTEIDDNDKI